MMYRRALSTRLVTLVSHRQRPARHTQTQASGQASKSKTLREQFQHAIGAEACIPKNSAQGRSARQKRCPYLLLAPSLTDPPDPFRYAPSLIMVVAPLVAQNFSSDACSTERPGLFTWASDKHAPATCWIEVSDSLRATVVVFVFPLDISHAAILRRVPRA